MKPSNSRISMLLKRDWDQHRAGALTGAGLTILLGLLLNFSRLGDPLANLSYDLLFLFRLGVPPSDCVILEMDEKSYGEYKQTYGLEWNRSLFAGVLKRLTRDGAHLVVFDVWFTEVVQPADPELVQAIKENRKVVLAGTITLEPSRNIVGFTEAPPNAAFAAVATAWGISREVPDTDGVVRKHYRGTENHASLAWQAAFAAGFAPGDRMKARWLNYYGPARTIPAMSYCEATNQPSGYFKDKIVFIGGRPKTGTPGVEVDEFRGPRTRWDNQACSGVEIVATMFLNLLNRDWLTRLPAGIECCLLLALGGLLGGGFALCRVGVAAGLGILGALLVGAAGIVLFWQAHIWFAWLVVAAGQIPFAVAWSVLFNSWKLARAKEELLAEAKTLARQKKELQKKLAAKESGNATPGPISVGGRETPRSIPDYGLLRCIGQGAYGEVWLARNTVGMYMAVKIIYRNSLGGPEAFEREFNGIRSFMPVSSGHPSLLRVLHVGRNDDEGYFYYVMEPGDDEVSGQKFEAESYSPRSLAKDLKRRARLSLRECVDLGLALASALEYLHSKQLVHRDIKPPNIIFLNGIPKLADVGLVTETDREHMSLVGTPDFMDQQLHGTPAGDLFSLGKVLYVTATGRKPANFPILPSDLATQDAPEMWTQFHLVLRRACQDDPVKSYRSAGEMQADLLRLQNRLAVQ